MEPTQYGNGQGSCQPSDELSEEPMPRMNVGWMFNDDPYKTLDSNLNHTQRVLTVRINNSTRAFVHSMIFGGVLLLFAAGCGKSNAVAAAVGAVVGVGLLAFGVRSLVKSLGYRRELRRVNGGG